MEMEKYTGIYTNTWIDWEARELLLDVIILNTWMKWELLSTWDLWPLPTPIPHTFSLCTTQHPGLATYCWLHDHCSIGVGALFVVLFHIILSVSGQDHMEHCHKNVMRLVLLETKGLLKHYHGDYNKYLFIEQH